MVRDGALRAPPHHEAERVELVLNRQDLKDSQPRKRGPRGHKRIDARLQRAMHSNVAKSGSPLPRGRRENVAPSPIFIVRLSKSGWGRLQKANEIGPCFGFGPGDRPHSSLFPLPHFEGDGAPTRRTAWSARPEL